MSTERESITLNNEQNQLPQYDSTSIATPPTTTNALLSPIQQASVIIFGATGATGGFILRELLESPHVSSVYSFVRRLNTFDISNKLVEIQLPPTVEEFTPELLAELWPHEVQIAAIFSALGSTAKQAGSATAFIDIDYGMNNIIATHGKRVGVKQFYLVSSVGSDSKSSNTYLQTKGRLEERLIELQFAHTYIFRPGILTNTNRPTQPSRPLESCSVFILKYFCCCFLNNCFSTWRPIDVHDIALIMVDLYQTHLQESQGEDTIHDPITYQGSQVLINLSQDIKDRRANGI